MDILLIIAILSIVFILVGLWFAFKPEETKIVNRAVGSGKWNRYDPDRY